jgi:hypothetical protein
MASNGAYLLQFSDESFRLFLKRLGIAERKTKTVRVPAEIRRNDTLLKRCIRGIADTDFTLIFTKNHNYPRISARFASKALVKDLEKALRAWGFTLNTKYDQKINDKRGFNYMSNHIYLDGPHNLRKWLKLIGFSNLRILSRYELWKKKGYLQPRSTLPERLAELNGLEGGGEK